MKNPSSVSTLGANYLAVRLGVISRP